MPPPYRRNPVAEARADFFGEERPRVFFPPVGQAGSFRPYYDPMQRANLALETDEFLGKRDDLATRKDENLTRRLELGSRRRTLPFMEQADIAQQRVAAQKAESDMRLNPFIEQERKAESQLGKAEAEAALADIPAAADYRSARRTAEIDELQSADPYAKRFRKPEDLDAYERLKETADPSLTGIKRQQWAQQQALRIAGDRDSVNLLNEAAYLGDKEAEGLVDVVTDSVGNVIGQRIKEGADPKKVAGIVMRQQRAQKDATEKRKAVEAQQSVLNTAISNLTRRINSYEHAYISVGKDLPTDPPEIAKAREDLSRLSMAQWELLKGQVPENARGLLEGGAAPAKTEEAPVEPVDQASLDSIFNRVKPPAKK